MHLGSQQIAPACVQSNLLGLGIGSWCCVVEPMLTELVKTILPLLTLGTSVGPIKKVPLPLVTNPFSTRWSPPAVLSGAVLMISGSLSALAQSVLRLVILMRALR